MKKETQLQVHISVGRKFRRYLRLAGMIFGPGPIVAALCATIALVAPARGQTCNREGCNYSNTYQGIGALSHVTSGIQDTAFGYLVLPTNNDGSNNTASGAYSMSNNASGVDNTAVGASAIHSDYFHEGSYNTAVGLIALAQQQEQIKALNAYLQKVRQSLELVKAAPRVVGNDR